MAILQQGERFEGTGVDEEECLSEVLKIFNGTAAGKVKVGMVE